MGTKAVGLSECLSGTLFLPLTQNSSCVCMYVFASNYVYQRPLCVPVEAQVWLWENTGNSLLSFGFSLGFLKFCLPGPKVQVLDTSARCVYMPSGIWIRLSLYSQGRHLTPEPSTLAPWTHFHINFIILARSRRTYPYIWRKKGKKNQKLKEDYVRKWRESEGEDNDINIDDGCCKWDKSNLHACMKMLQWNYYVVLVIPVNILSSEFKTVWEWKLPLAEITIIWNNVLHLHCNESLYDAHKIYFGWFLSFYIRTANQRLHWVSGESTSSSSIPNTRASAQMSQWLSTKSCYMKTNMSEDGNTIKGITLVYHQRRTDVKLFISNLFIQTYLTQIQKELGIWLIKKIYY